MTLWTSPQTINCTSLIAVSQFEQFLTFTLEGMVLAHALTDADRFALLRAGYPTTVWDLHPGAYLTSIRADLAIGSRQRTSLVCVHPRNDTEIETKFGAELCAGDVIVPFPHLTYGQYMNDPKRIERIEADDTRRGRHRAFLKCLKDNRSMSILLCAADVYHIFGSDLLAKVQGY